MRSSVAVFHRIGCRKLVPWLLGQPRRMPPSRNQESLWQPYGASLCSVPADLLLPARRRSELCRGASYRPVWAMPPLCPTMRQSSTSRAGAPLSIGWPLRSSDSLCSSRNRSTAVKMSSSSSSASNSDGKGKPKPKSPFHKRGSLQSTTSPGECWWSGGPIKVRGLSAVTPIRSQKMTPMLVLRHLNINAAHAVRGESHELGITLKICNWSLCLVSCCYWSIA